MKGPHGGFVISGTGEIERPEPDPPLVEFTNLGDYIADSNRNVIPIPVDAGGGTLDMQWRFHNACRPPAPSGDVYDCLVPWSDHPDASLPSDFIVSRRSPGAGVVLSMRIDVLDRSYGWRMDRALRESIRGDWAPSTAPDSVESPDGQSGLDAFIGHLQACPRGDIRSCECCRCPECGAIGIRARKNKTPTYACNNPSCDGDPFEEPALRPARSEEPRGD